MHCHLCDVALIIRDNYFRLTSEKSTFQEGLGNANHGKDAEGNHHPGTGNRGTEAVVISFIFIQSMVFGESNTDNIEQSWNGEGSGY